MKMTLNPKLSSWETYKKDVESSFLQIVPLVFDGESYDLWKVKMKSYMTSRFFWFVEKDYEVFLLSESPTMAWIKHHKEKKNQEGEGKNMPICWCFLDDLHKDRDSQFTQRNLRLFKGKVWRGWTRLWHASTKLDEEIWGEKDEGIQDN